MKYKIPLLFVLVVVIITMHKAHGKKSTDVLGINRKLPNIYENRGGDFKLTGPEGNEISSVSFRGKIILIYFGYTYCPDFCPMALSYLNAMMKEFAELAKDVQVLFITIDPERDTHEKLKEYVPYFNPDFIGMTGSISDIKEIAKKYGVGFFKQQVESEQGYFLAHTDRVFLIDKNGRYRGHYRPQSEIEKLTADIKSLFD